LIRTVNNDDINMLEQQKRTRAMLLALTFLLGAIAVYIGISACVSPFKDDENNNNNNNNGKITVDINDSVTGTGTGTSSLRAKRERKSDVSMSSRTHLAVPSANILPQDHDDYKSFDVSTHCGFREYERVDGLPIVGDVFASADHTQVHLVVENRAGCESGVTSQFTKDTRFQCVFEEDGSVTQSIPITNHTAVQDTSKSTTFETTAATRRSRFHRFVYTITCPVPVHLQATLPRAAAESTTAYLTLRKVDVEDDVAEYSSSRTPEKSQLEHLPICSNEWPQRITSNDKKKYDLALMTRVALSYKDNQNPNAKESMSITHAEFVHWIEYHSAIGVEHFYIYSDNQGDHSRMLQDWCQPYIQQGLISLIDYPYQDLLCDSSDDINPALHDRTVRMGQLVGLNAALRRYQDQVEWLAHWDVDEYLYVRHDSNADLTTSTRQAMAELLHQAKDVDDADEIEFQRPFYGRCDSNENAVTPPFVLPFQGKLCTTDSQEFGKVILRTSTVGRAFFHYALEAIPPARTIRTKPVDMSQAHLAHFRKGKYGEINYDIPSSVFDEWKMPLQDQILEQHVITSMDVDVTVLPSSTNVTLPKVLAIYFPQYHEDPLNNELWVDGFTDWVSLNNSATRNRLGYRIPRPTNDLGYYDLTETRPRKRQGELAKEYDVDGFVYHVYWFYDRTHPGPTLAAPVEAMLRDGHPDLPFAFNWCLTSWVNTWMGKDVFQKDANGNIMEGGGDMMLQEQFFNVTDAEIQEHYNWLKQFFHHEHYIRVANQPLLFLYKHHEDSAPVLRKLRQLAMEDGFDGLHLVVGRKAPPANIFEPADNLKPRLQRKLLSDVETLEQVGLDAAHAPASVYNQSMTYPYPLPYVTESYTVPHWCVHSNGNNKAPLEGNEVTGLLTAFDNTPRRDPSQARIYGYGSKQKVLTRFRHNLMATIYFQTCCLQSSGDSDVDTRFVTINAWNEWGEGMALEPSDVYGHGFLEAIRDVKSEVAAMHCNGGMLPSDVVGPSPIELSRRRKHNKLLLEASDADLAQGEAAAAMARMLEGVSLSMSMPMMSLSMSMPMMSLSMSM
jgi:Glycosyltransferase WbsX/Glycosyltransferase family 92